MVIASGYQRLVVKLGTSLLTAGGRQLHLPTMSSLVEQIAHLHHQGQEIIIVSSGAIAAGRHELAISQKSRALLFKQVLASVGQSHLMHVYEQLFGLHKITVAQALLTRKDLTDRHGYLNARNTLLALMELQVIAVINENDVVAIDEIRGNRIGDNDNLSAMVANLVDADLLVILTDIGGLFTSDPHSCPDARLITRVERIDDRIESLAGGSASTLGTGGMATKIEAARLATASGVNVIIADGREPGILLKAASGEPCGTLFPSHMTRLESRKRWMLTNRASQGRIVVDEGALLALREKEKSLLPAGIREVQGDFQRGDIVDIVDQAGEAFACGISNYSSREIALIKGSHSKRIASLVNHVCGTEVVHRNNMVLLS
ncbi:MAG: proB [Dehalococcoidia bacterium]|nr:proB [Dehalococcoidia bacterium]